MTFDLQCYLSSHKDRVDRELVRVMDDPDIPASLAKAMRYSLDAGGKRIRPILSIAGAEAVGGSWNDVRFLAIALEMIHTFSLIHDDLPAMDNDDLRRGKPTNHKVFGEAAAVLAGDALLAEAFFLLSKSSGSAPTILRVIADVAEAAGCRGMTGGQMIDMEATGKNIDEKTLENIHRHKTGKLLAVGSCASAKLCGARPEEITALREYGDCLGLAFQIADDILDIEGVEAEIGKRVGSDIGQNKSTYPAVLGMEASRKKAKGLVDRAITALSRFDKRATALRSIATFVIERKK